MNKILITLSIIGSIIGITLSIIGTVIGLSSSSGPLDMSDLLILPSILFFLMNLIDILITVRVIKKGLTYSIITALIKLIIIIIIIYSLLEDLKNGYFDFLPSILILITSCLVTFPSVLNVLKLSNNIKKN